MKLFESWAEKVTHSVKEHQPSGSILIDERDMMSGTVHTLRLQIGDKISEPLRVCRLDILIAEDPNAIVSLIFMELLKRMPNG